jgi:hypothetical protein
MKCRSLGFVEIEEKKYEFLRRWRNKNGYKRFLLPMSETDRLIRIYSRSDNGFVRWYNETSGTALPTNVYTILNKMDMNGLYRELRNYAQKIARMECGAGILNQGDVPAAAERYTHLGMADLRKKRVAAHRILAERRRQKSAKMGRR